MTTTFEYGPHWTSAQRRAFGRYVYVLRGLSDAYTPIFHGFDAGHGREDDDEQNEARERTRRWVSRVRCGRVAYSSSWVEVDGVQKPESHSTSAPGVLLHIDHAVKFARPCRKCWPADDVIDAEIIEDE